MLADWQIRLENIEVQSAQESGDEPYFVAIGFRTKFLSPNSTKVFWSGFLTEEWAKGIKTGESQEIPKEMGNIPFELVQLKELSNEDPLELVIQRTELMGVLILAFESDWTSFSFIRSLMNELQDSIEIKLKSLVENLEIDPNDPERSFDEAVEEIRSEFEGTRWEKLKILIRSGFDPDDPIGNHFLMFVATRGFREQSSKLVQLAEGPFVLRFYGEGAKYSVRGSIISSALNISDSLSLTVR